MVLKRQKDLAKKLRGKDIKKRKYKNDKANAGDQFSNRLISIFLLFILILLNLIKTSIYKLTFLIKLSSL